MQYQQLPRTVADVCDVLRWQGRADLAERIKYFASDEDLDAGDVPVTLDSALGFLAFFDAVESAGQTQLACSPEGWICAVWTFPDCRRVSLWFVDQDKVLCAARQSDGRFADLPGDSEAASRLIVTEKLVESGEWFTWRNRV